MGVMVGLVPGRVGAKVLYEAGVVMVTSLQYCWKLQVQ